jgi:hypothetical protein
MMIDETPASIEAPSEKQPSQSFWQKNKVVIITIVVVLAVAIILVGFVSLAMAHPAGTAIVRDIMIIAMAFMSLLIALALIILIYQIAMLTLLLRDEIKPLLESANETMDTLRGTTVFMSENIVEPAIKASSAVSGVRRVLEVLVGLRPSAKRKP